MSDLEETLKKPATKDMRHHFFDTLEYVYSARLILIPFYACLVVALVAYAITIVRETIQMICDIFSVHSSENTLINVLAIVDIVMIANLIVMILIGSYSIFVRKLEISSGKKPQWLDHISSGSLKVKISMSVVGVSTIHLLKNFIEAKEMTYQELVVKSALHLMFILSTYMMARTNKILEGNDGHEPTTH